jgi:hypothetical protein
MQLAGFFACLVAVPLFFIDGWAATGNLLLVTFRWRLHMPVDGAEAALATDCRRLK